MLHRNVGPPVERIDADLFGEAEHPVGRSAPVAARHHEGVFVDGLDDIALPLALNLGDIQPAGRDQAVNGGVPPQGTDENAAG